MVRVFKMVNGFAGYVVQAQATGAITTTEEFSWSEP